MSIIVRGLNIEGVPGQKLLVSGSGLKHVSSQDGKSCLSRLGHSIADVFINAASKPVRFFKQSDAIDKLAKLAIYISDLCLGIFRHHEADEYEINTASNVGTILRDMRAVVALTNVFRGAIPGFIKSVQNCYKSIIGAMGGGNVEEEGGEPKALPYNRIMLSRSDYIRDAITSGCTAVGALTYCATFGAIRPVMFANRCAGTDFLDTSVKKALGDSALIIMTVNHAASVVGDSCRVWSLVNQYRRTREAIQEQYTGAVAVPTLYGEEVNQDILLGELRSSHIKNLRDSILGIIEKGIELVVDFLKLVALPFSSTVLLIIRSALAVVFSAIGVYRVWLKLP